MKTIDNSFQFQRITLLSHNEKSGRVIKLFPKTLIDSEENTKGKSTIINSLFWGVGCDVNFEETWCSDIATLVEFSSRGIEYKIHRTQDMISIYDTITNDWTDYPSVTSEFLSQLNKILNFNILLQYPKALSLSKVPPSYFFATTYVEQMNGWTNIWSCFKNLNAFDKNKKLELLKYMCGILDQEFYINKREHNEFTQKNVVLKTLIERDTSTLSYIDELKTVSISTKVHETSRAINKVESQINEKRDLYLENSSNLASIENEIELIQVAIGELDKDYEYSICNIESTDISCPTCGVIHKNDLLNRFSIINDVNSLIKQEKNLIKEKNNIQEYLLELTSQIDSNYKEISQLLNKNEVQDNLNSYLMEKSLAPFIGDKVISYKNEVDSNDKIKKNIVKANKIIENNNLKEKEKDLVDFFNNLCVKLETEIIPKINFYGILNHVGGGANHIKVMLAIRLTILKAIYSHAESAIPPFVIDSPRQQDIDDQNYQLLLEIIQDVPDDVQLILAAVKNDLVDNIKSKFEEILLKGKILLPEQYSTAKLMMEK